MPKAEAKSPARQAKNHRKTPVGAVVYITLAGSDTYARGQNVSIYKGEDVIFLCDEGTLTVCFKGDTPLCKGRVLWADRGVPLRTEKLRGKALSRGRRSATFPFSVVVTKESGAEYVVDPGLIVEVMAPGVKIRPDGQEGCVGCCRWSAVPPPPGK